MSDPIAEDAVAQRRDEKDRLLEAALIHAAFDGWNRKTLKNAARDLDVEPLTAQRLFPQAGDSLLDWLDDWLDRQMAAAVDRAALLQLPVRRRVALIVEARLAVMAPHREAMRRALAGRTLPTQIPAGTTALWRTVDLIWDLAGLPGNADEGWGWYTRRASLAAVLASTFLYWLEDQSEDQAQTRAFLARRIEDVIRVGRLRARMQDMVRSLPGMRAAR